VYTLVFEQPHVAKVNQVTESESSDAVYDRYPFCEPQRLIRSYDPLITLCIFYAGCAMNVRAGESGTKV
jgi:hypothetical protein